MKYDLHDAMALLRRTPAVLDALLRDLPDDWTLRNEGSDTWSAYDVLGHLIHAERTDWLPRARMILEHGETKSFEPFDRTAQLRQVERKSLSQLLEDFAHLRSENLNAFEALQLKPGDLDRRGRHPTLGAVTLSELLATWAAHDLTHLHQISRVMAHQYREAVGPWSKYLGVLHCGGHSAQA
jgi:DinB superfamily